MGFKPGVSDRWQRRRQGTMEEMRVRWGEPRGGWTG